MANSIRAVDRALDILLEFSPENPVLSLSQVAGRLDLPKSTVHRLLSTLEGKGFVKRDAPTGCFHLGFRIVEMASLVLKDMDLPRWAHPYLVRLAEETGETVDLAVLDNSRVIYLQVIESPQRVKIAAAAGQRLPVHCTASGKAFLSFLPKQMVNTIVSGRLEKYTAHTLIDRPSVENELRLTRERGFSISEKEYEDDINAVAAPILDADRFPVAVIAIVGPSYRMPSERMLLLGQSVVKTIESMAREVGLEALSTIASRSQGNSLVRPSKSGGSQARP